MAEYSIGVLTGWDGASYTVLTPLNNSEGFRVFTPFPESNVYYVSEAGDDTNDGLTPETSLRTSGVALKKMRDGFPDFVLFNCGDTFTGSGPEVRRGFGSGAGNSRRAVIAYYGDVSLGRPRIVDQGWYEDKGFTDTNILGLEFYNSTKDDSLPGFDINNVANYKISFVSTPGTPVGNLHFEDCVFDQYKVQVQEFSNELPYNITLRRIIHKGNWEPNTGYSSDPKPSGMYLEKVQGYSIEQTFWEYGGWSPTAPTAGASLYNHNIYIQYSCNNDFKYTGNINCDGSSHGLHARAGGVVKDSVFSRNSVQVSMGYTGTGGSPLPAGYIGQMENLAVCETASMRDKGDINTGGGFSTSAAWGVVFDNYGEASLYARDVSVGLLAPTTDRELVTERDFYLDGGPAGPNGPFFYNTQSYHITSDTQGDGLYQDPGRTLGDYFLHIQANGDLQDMINLGVIPNLTFGSDNHENFKSICRNRYMQKWHDAIDGKTVADWINAGYAPL